MRPMRTRFVASAIAASIAQPSKTIRVGSAPSETRWSKPHSPSNPASSAIRHTSRWTSIGWTCGESFSPMRRGCTAAYIRCSMEAARFERQVRTEASEVFIVYGGARRIGRIDLHYARFEVHGTHLIDQLDEELVQTHDPEREDFLVTVYRGEELGFYSDEYDSDEEEEDEEEEDDREA